MMAQKMLVFGVIALLIALLVLIEIPRGSLCELQISQGSLRIVARMACESAR
ncbi:Hok/Gef family protein [Erwinia sp. E602]|uniref:Hok/Gef family protein n=1 Tax=Erwinia sp. E602 TaxID=2675378 RepID=UPI001BAB3DCA|nr:Hok/Gef family protein [Erwinia sp. E602]